MPHSVAFVQSHTLMSADKEMPIVKTHPMLVEMWHEADWTCNSCWRFEYPLFKCEISKAVWVFCFGLFGIFLHCASHKLEESMQWSFPAESECCKAV